MESEPNYNQRFVAVNYFEAVYKTKINQQTILFELRVSAAGNRRLSTVLNGREIRATSLHDFVLNDQDCVSIVLTHRVSILWNGSDDKANLTEEFVGVKDDGGVFVRIRLALAVNGTIFASEECDTFTEAIEELADLMGETISWKIKTCHHCIYSRPAFRHPVSDRDELRCFRDAPEAFAEIRQKGKFVSNDIFFLGDYFVNAFHTCSAWKPTGTLIE